MIFYRSLQYTSYQTTPYCTPSDPIESPTDVQSVQKVVLRALLLGKTLKAFGSRHSITDVICTDGIPLSMEKFKSKVLNADFTVTLGAGVKMGEALEFLEQRGRTFIHVPGFSKQFIHYEYEGAN